ncbi:MAG: glycosyltransferase family 4 protein [Candidatus Latescibacter sp.]|nr:glycosyltransferase family 4 protein [Candidatus Latescibacter sp.]
MQAITVPWYNACADYAILLARGLQSLGHRVTVAGGNGSPVIDKAREFGLAVYDLSSPASGNPLTLFLLAKAYRRFAIENEVALVNVHHGRDHLVWSLALCGTGIPLVRTSGSQVPPNRHSGSRYLIKNRTAGIIASCCTVQRFYTEGFGIEPENIPVINGGVDSMYYTPGHPRNVLRSALGIPEKAFVFGIVGRYSPVKGHRYFFAGAERVAGIFPDAWFVAAGWEAQLNEDTMRKLASEAGIIDRTRFTGRQNDIRDLLVALDAGVIASVGSETVCRIALEYMAMGIPVIGAATNVIPEIVRHERTGYIVPQADPESIAYAMGQLISSPERSRTLGKTGREIIEEEYSLEKFALKTLEAYRKMTIDV